MKLNMKIFDSMKITTNIRYGILLIIKSLSNKGWANAHPLSSKILIYNNLRKRLIKRFPAQA